MRMLHTMLRVEDLDKALDFYVNTMGMKLLRKSDNTEYEYTLAFVGYGDESETAVLELTYNWGENKYDKGNAYGHVAFEVEAVNAVGKHERVCRQTNPFCIFTCGV